MLLASGYDATDLISFGGGESPVQPDLTCMLGQKFAFYVMSTVSVIRHH
jgi:hypothetical protein